MYLTKFEALAKHPKCFCGATATDIMQVTNDIGSQWLESLCMNHVIAVSKDNPRVTLDDDTKERMRVYLLASN